MNLIGLETGFKPAAVRFVPLVPKIATASTTATATTTVATTTTTAGPLPIEEKTSSSAHSTRPPAKLQKFIDLTPSSKEGHAPMASVRPHPKPQPPGQRGSKYQLASARHFEAAGPSASASLSSRPSLMNSRNRTCILYFGADLRNLWCNSCKLGLPCTRRP